MTYLTSDLQGRARYYRFTEDSAHSAIAMKCLTYLSFDAFADGPCHQPWESGEQRRRYPLLDYAAQRWPVHVQQLSDYGDELWKTLKSFLFSQDENRGNFQAWVQMLLPTVHIEAINRTPPLYYAASYGLTEVVRFILEAGADTEVHGGRCGATPINIASFRGHHEVVQVLLEYGADPNAADEDGLTGLQWAIMKRHRKVMEVLNDARSKKVIGLDQHRVDVGLPQRQNPGVQPLIGRLLVTRAQLEPGWPSELWWLLVGLAESQSENHVGEAIHQAAKARLKMTGDTALDGTVITFASVVGQGVSACIAAESPETAGIPDNDQRYSVLIGSFQFLSDRGCVLSENFETDMNFKPAEEITNASIAHYAQVWVAINGIVAGMIALSLYP